jgi:hypothetical protein
MPTLDDAPTLAKLESQKLASASSFTGGSASPTEAQLSKLDLVQIYDSSQRKVKTITVSDLAVALGITLA